MKVSLIGYIFFFTSFAYINGVARADSLSIPSATIPSGYDRITTSDGTTCESTIASDMYVQTGLMGVKIDHDSAHSPAAMHHYERRQDRDKFGVYAQIVIPIGNKRERIDCNRLYELEIRHLKEQLVKLKLESMSDELWTE